MLKRVKKIEKIDEDMNSISKKEQEILESYNDDFIDYSNKISYDDEDFDYEYNDIDEILSDKSSEQLVVLEEKEEESIEQKLENIIGLMEGNEEKYESKPVQKVIFDDEEDEEEEEKVKPKKEKKVKEKKIKEKKIKKEQEQDYEESEYKEKKSSNKYQTIINLCFSIIMAILIMITIDVISVSKYETGPYFAIPKVEYDDGGTVEYVGLGYKVIDYNQLQGRNTKEIGTWSLKYNTEPVDAKDIDLAIEFNEDEVTSYKKYYKNFMRIESTLLSMDVDKNQITIGYVDEDGKYSYNIKCKMGSDVGELGKLKINEKITVIGTVKNYKFKTSKKAPVLVLDNCFAEQIQEVELEVEE